MNKHQPTGTPGNGFVIALIACGLALCAAAAADEVFDANLAVARQNLATEAGAAHDRALGEAMRKLPAATRAITACIEGNPGDHAVQGYFHFSTPTAYTVALSPSGPFSSCLAKALAGHALPVPPTVPYFNHFTFQ